MPKYKLRLPSPGSYLYGDDGDITYIGTTAAEAHEFFAEEWGDPTEWVHPIVLRGRVVYKADVESGDAHEDAQPGDTTFDQVTRDSDAALNRELRPSEVLGWERGVISPWWTYGPNGFGADPTYHAQVGNDVIGNEFESREAAREAVDRVVAEHVEAWKAAHPEFYRPLPEEPDDGVGSPAYGNAS